MIFLDLTDYVALPTNELSNSKLRTSYLNTYFDFRPVNKLWRIKCNCSLRSASIRPGVCLHNFEICTYRHTDALPRSRIPRQRRCGSAAARRARPRARRRPRRRRQCRLAFAIQIFDSPSRYSECPICRFWNVSQLRARLSQRIIHYTSQKFFVGTAKSGSLKGNPATGH